MNDKNKKFYIQAISTMLDRCNDVSLLDLVYKILVKSEGVEDEN